MFNEQPCCKQRGIKHPNPNRKSLVASHGELIPKRLKPRKYHYCQRNHETISAVKKLNVRAAGNATPSPATNDSGASGDGQAADGTNRYDRTNANNGWTSRLSAARSAAT